MTVLATFVGGWGHAEPLVPASMLLDGIHPSSEGQRIIAGALAGPVAEVLRKRR